MYTYNPAYHHSATFVPVNVEELKKQEKLAHRQKFVSKKDWVYPEVKTLRQCNEHPKKPDPARCDALTHVSLCCDLSKTYMKTMILYMFMDIYTLKITKLTFFVENLQYFVNL